MERPELGQKVVITALAQKGREFEKVADYEDEYGQWVSFNSETSWYVQRIDAANAVYIGYRYWSIGKTYGHDYEPREYREVWLVVTSPGRNPVAVFPEHCEVA